MKFTGDPTKQGITGNIQGDLYSDISTAGVMAVGVPMDEALLDIGMNDRRAVIHLEYDC